MYARDVHLSFRASLRRLPPFLSSPLASALESRWTGLLQSRNEMHLSSDFWSEMHGKFSFLRSFICARWSKYGINPRNKVKFPLTEKERKKEKYPAFHFDDSISVGQSPSTWQGANLVNTLSRFAIDNLSRGYSSHMVASHDVSFLLSLFYLFQLLDIPVRVL